MTTILNFWLRFFLVRLHLDDGAGGGGGDGSLLGAKGGGGAIDWRADLSEDIRSDPSLAVFKAKDHKEALNQVSKSYINAQRLIGVDKIAKPNDKWTPEQWKAYHREIGVPDTHDKYTLPDVKLAEGLTIIPEKIDKFKKVFHEAGLTPKQVSAVMKTYFEDVNGEHTGRAEATATQMRSAETELRAEYGDKYDANLDIARAVMKKHGSDGLLAKLEEKGLASDPDVVRMFVKLGMGMMEDHAGGGGDGLLLQTATQAMQEINSLKSDGDFQKVLNDRKNPGHKAAVEKWLDLHAKAAARKE